MEEENKNQNQTIDKENLKKETVETVNQVKETIKNVDIKNDAKEATGFVTSMFKDPLGTIKKISEDTNNKAFKIAIIFLIIWVAAEFIDAILSIAVSRYWSGYWPSRLLGIVKTTIAPILSVLALSIIVYAMNKKEKKNLVTTISSVVVAKIPVILASVVSLATLISSNASALTVRFSGFCSAISVVLTYFSIKSLFGEEQNSKFIKKFVIIYAIYYVVSLVLYYLGIYI